MKPAELNRDLDRGAIPPLVCLWGEEEFHRERTARRLLDRAVAAEARDFNLQVFSGREARGSEILEAVLTLPVFSPRRVVWVKDIHELAAGELEQLMPVVQDPPPETVLLLTGGKIDGRRKFFQALKKRQALVEFKRPYPNQIPGFVQELARETGIRFTEEGLALFCRRMGSSLSQIHGEMGKLVSYLGERTLADRADVAAVVSDLKEDSVFELTDALGRRQTGEALRLLERLLAEGIVPLVILTMIVRHFRQLWKIRELMEQGVGRRELPGKAGVNPYFLDNLVAQAKTFDPGQLRACFELFLETDLALKSSGAHPAVQLEQLLLKVAGTRP